MTHIHTDGTAALKSQQPAAVSYIDFKAPTTEGPTRTVRPARHNLSKLLFDDDRCYTFVPFSQSVSCSPLKLALVYACSLLLMIAGLVLVTAL
ncbi:MAG: hypothetical protein ACI36W_00615 [Coriobacteriales bacterium]